MSPAMWALAAIVGSFVASVSGALLVEYAVRRRDRRQAAVILAAQQPPAVPDAVDEHYRTAAALLQPDRDPDQDHIDAEARAPLAALDIPVIPDPRKEH